MNEEEIIKNIEKLKEYCDNPKIITKKVVYFDEYQMSTLQNLAYRLGDELIQEKEKNKKLEAVIDMMAEDISHTDLFPWDNINVEQVKQYYFKKARGEKDVKD